MDELIQYIYSTFNLSIDLDAKQFSPSSKLKLLEKDRYNVYITPVIFPEIQIYESEYFGLVENAIKEWSDATDQKIIFQTTTVPSDADILVYWVKSNLKSVGMQYMQYNKPCISIGIMKANGHIYDFEYVYSIILHELGHVLGLGHSPSPKDIMHNFCNNVYTISENDKFVLDLIYKIGNNKTYQESENTINKYISELYKPKMLNVKNKNLNEDLEIISMLNKQNVFLQKEIKKYKFDN